MTEDVAAASASAVEENRGRVDGGLVVTPSRPRVSDRSSTVICGQAAAPPRNPVSRNLSRSRPSPCAVGSAGDTVAGSRKSSSGATARTSDAGGMCTRSASPEDAQARKAPASQSACASIRIDG